MFPRKSTGQLARRLGVAVGALAVAVGAGIPQAHATPGGVTETWGELEVAAFVHDHTTTPTTVSVKLSVNGFVTVDDPQYWIDHGATVSVTCTGWSYGNYGGSRKVMLFSKTFFKNSAEPLVAYPPGGGFMVHASPTAVIDSGAFNVNRSAINGGEDEIWCDLSVGRIPGSTAQLHTQTNHIYGWF
ncbi:hypothetical protein [Kribbella sp. NPDC004536]|uniref:hypothetical protein n=1 Tax=Kribbella sp. NPDC004536 TaxID=3364106 RepID=UPI003685880A